MGSPAVVRKISRMSQTAAALASGFRLNIRIIRSRRKDVHLMSSWCGNMGLGKKQQWWYTANTEARGIALPKFNFLHHGGRGHMSQWAPQCVISPHTYKITVEMLLICSSKNVGACRAGLKKVAICFQQKLWGCLDLASCSTRRVIHLQNL